MSKDIVFKEIEGCNGHYMVSNTGLVMGMGGDLLNAAPTILATTINHNGYMRVSLTIGHKKVWARVHRLVLKAFVGEPEEGQECCHNDGNSFNNNLENLRWGTREENRQDAFEHNSLRLLTDNGVRHIRKLHRNGATMHQIAAHLNKRYQLIWKVCTRRSYGHVAD